MQGSIWLLLDTFCHVHAAITSKPHSNMICLKLHIHVHLLLMFQI